MRRLTVTGVLVVLLGALAACTPAAEPIQALAVRDGLPVGLLYVCRDGFSQFSVYENPTGPTPPSPRFVSWHIAGDAPAGVLEVPLFGPLPPGWEPSTGDVGSDLTELAPGVRYSLGGRSHRDAMTVSFTTDDFAGIGADQVLVTTGRDKMKVVPRAAFERTARKSCD
jgi:hypothetical protein